MNHFIKLFLSILSLFIILGCSSDAEFKSSSSLYVPDVTGKFIDDAVQGLEYNCTSGLSGLTNEDGNYTCKKGDDVTLRMGSVTLGTIAAQSEFLTPYSFFPNNIEAVINMARLIQFLDMDGDENNSIITLNTNIVALLPQDLNFTSESFVSDLENNLSITLVTAQKALTTLNANIIALGGSIPDGGNIAVADAGEDQNVTNFATVTLDGNGSWDADLNDTLTYQWSFELKPSDSNATLSDPNSVRTTFIADVNGTYVVQLVVNDGTMNSAADSVKIIASNMAPTAIFDAFSVEEDSSYSGVLSANDENNDTLSYIKVTDVQNGTLSVDLNGSFVYTPNGNYNGVDSFSYRVSDIYGDSDTKTVAITVLSVGDAPVITTTTPVSVSENQVAAFTINATDGDGDTLSYAISGTDVSSFDLNSSSGVVSFKVAPNYEVKNIYELIAIASDGNLSGTKDVTINITNLPEKAVIADTTIDVDENATALSVVGTLNIVDVGDSAIYAFTLSGNGSENFDINSSGSISVKAGALLDYETTPSYLLSVYATSASGDSNTVSLKVDVNNIAEIVPSLLNTSLTFNEDVQYPYVLGSLTIATQGDTPISRITLSGAGSTNFEISLNGEINISSIASFDYETTTSYTLSAVATNGAGNSAAATLNIYVNNVIDTVPTLSDSTASVIENAVAGTNMGTLGITDVGDSAITSITLSGDGSEKFEVATDGAITLKSNYTLDYETQTLYNLQAYATNTAGESDSVALDVSITDYPFNPLEIASLNASDAEESDLFGSAVDVSGDYIIVGAKQENADGVVFAGSAYVFKKASDETLFEIAKLNATGKELGDYFGNAVAIDGDYMVVGAYKSDTPATDQGDVYLFKRHSDTSITQIAKISASDPEDNDYFGNAVAISGEYIIVGAYEEDTGALNVGSAYLFKINSDTNITQIAKLQADTPTAGSYFGNAVAIDGDYIVVGAYKEANGVTDSGAAYIFKRNSDTNITQIAKLQAATPTTGSYFGNALSISGTTVAIGAYQETTTSSYAGSAYIFTINSATNVSQVSKIVSQDVQASAYFGSAISISGDYLLIGAESEDLASSDMGAAYTYSIDVANSSVSFIEKLVASDGAVSDYFSRSVAIDANNIILGAPTKDTSAVDAGQVYVYDAEPLGVAP